MSDSNPPPDESREMNPEESGSGRLTPRFEADKAGSATPILSVFAVILLAGLVFVPPAVSTAPDGPTADHPTVTPAPVPTLEQTPTPAPTSTPTTRPPVVSGAGGGPTGGSA